MAQNVYGQSPGEDASQTVTAIINRMGNVLFETTAVQGACTVTDLINAGFTSAEIIEHINDARTVAASREASKDNVR
ncbi:hypothetical protein [Pseudochelatococcus sp. G4_1912]|uniref:hypothetical protein n=1 Tax=Pseudochelatococcus sp. G4_1912 TaxID=3114288 RepID=UPI0039C5B609